MNSATGAARLPVIELAWGKFELGFLFVFGKDEVGGKVRATFGDQFLDEARAAVGDEALDFLDGEFFAAEHALYLKNTAQGAIGLRFGDVERLGREHERALVVKLTRDEGLGLREIDGDPGLALDGLAILADAGFTGRKFPGELRADASKEGVEGAAFFRDESDNEVGLGLGDQLDRDLAGDGLLAH